MELVGVAFWFEVTKQEKSGNEMQVMEAAQPYAL